MRSIRQYLLSRILWGASLVLAVGSVLIALAIRQLDTWEFDELIEDEARMLATLVLREDRAIEVDFAGELTPEFETAEDAEYFQFRLLDGTIIERSDMLGERDLPFLPDALGAPVFRNLRLPDGRPGRLVQIAFPPRKVGPEDGIQPGDRFRIPEGTDPETVRVVLTLARSRRGLDMLLRKVYLTLATVDVLLVGLIALVLRGALRKGLRPLADLNAQLARLGPDTLNQRLLLNDVPTEVAILPATVNSLMEALQTSFERERRFTSDVAHELRTPVAEFRAACEVGAKWASDPALVERRFGNLRESAANMERILNDLLDLSRLGRGTVHLESMATDVATLVDSCWERVCNSGIGSGRRFDNCINRALRLNTDPLKLEQIVFNLLNNAARYSPPGATIVSRSEQLSAGGWELNFSNPTQDLDQEDLRYIFERFWRKDAARTAGGHAGLGLSIVQSLADALGVQVAANLTTDKVFTVRLGFPSHRTV